MNTQKNPSWIKPIAKLGLAAKGLVYCLTGLLAFMSAFQFGGQSSEKTNQQGIFKFIQEQPGGKIILIVLSVGLLSYSIWRFIQTFLDSENKGDKLKGLAKRFTYFASGITYLSIFYFSVRFILSDGSESSGNSKNQLANSVLEQPAGQWLLAIIAAIIAGVGIYQIWYGNSEKYRKHVDIQELDRKASSSLLRAGKVGYISRGIVWLVIAFLFVRAALNNKASEAGDTGSAFNFIEQSTFGNYLLATLGFGLICYGVMNFIRAAFEKFRY